MYLNDITITFLQSCVADSQKIRFKGRLSTDITAMLPYINSVLKDAIYNKNVPSLTFKKEFRIITLHSNELAVSKAINETDAYDIIDLVKNLANETFEDKDEIIPLNEMRQKPSAIEVYSHLPKLNCKKCGERTCLAFASKIVMGMQKINSCKFLKEPQNKEDLIWMEDFIQIFGY